MSTPQQILVLITRKTDQAARRLCRPLQTWRTQPETRRKHVLYFLLSLCTLPAFAADATVTGRVFDVYHRPVRGARVATMQTWFADGRKRSYTLRLPEKETPVDDAGNYRLSLPPGRYTLAVLPPPRVLDFATVFPAYYQDTVDFDKSQPIDLSPGELRSFVDFLLLEVESHRLEGEVTGTSKRTGAVSVALSHTQGYVDPLETVAADSQDRFHFDHVPAGIYELTAVTPGGARSAPVRIEVGKPEIHGIQIHLRAAAR